MSAVTYLTYIAVMAGVTYLIRMIPLAAFHKKINSRFVQSFLYYVPFAVLGAMTFPDILFSTSCIWSALAGFVVAMALAFAEKDLLTVAISACFTVFVTEQLLALL